nr:MAG TPA: hypothetical protein [Caudoviricetes sp.]
MNKPVSFWFGFYGVIGLIYPIGHDDVMQATIRLPFSGWTYRYIWNI